MVHRIIVAATCLMLGVTGAKAGWCGADDATNWKEFASLFSAGPPVSSNRPVIYVLGAPWCPYCAEVFKAVHNRRYGFDVQFVLGQGTNATHRAQIADVATEGTDQSLMRVYVQHAARADGVTQAQSDFINEVQVVADTALSQRFGDSVKKWGTPISFLYLNGRIAVVAGAPNLEKMDELLTATPSPSYAPTTRRFVSRPVPAEIPVTANAFAVKNNIRLRILPDKDALSAGCLQEGQGLKVAGRVQVDGKDWYVFKPYSPGTYLRIYGLAKEFQLQ